MKYTQTFMMGIIHAVYKYIEININVENNIVRIVSREYNR